MLMLFAVAALALPVPSEDMVVHPQWVRTPSSDDVGRTYPKDARRKGVTGESAMVCTVTRKGTLTDCGVTLDRPQGHGFGAAALKLAPLFRMKEREWKGGRAVEGRRIRIPVEWRL